MFKRLNILLALTLLSVSCEEEGKPSYTPKPAIEISVENIADSYVTLSIKSVNTDEVYALAMESPVADEPDAIKIVEEGYAEEGGKITVPGLEREREYMIYAVGIRGDMYSSVHKLTITTPFLYDWEAAREEIPSFADLDLIPGGMTKKTPNTWDSDRIAPHLTFTDKDGKERWLHEAFLFIGGEDASRGVSLCIANGTKSASQDSWKDFADYWLASGGVTDVLDKAISDAIARIGKPSFRHCVVITMPDPVMLEYFSDKNSSTTYWGNVHGRQLDFKETSDQVLAYMWYIDYVRELWDKAAPENLELAGFYILSEELVAKPSGWNYAYKRWDQILPDVSDYLHSMKYGLFWIPYYQADGHDMTDALGIDYTWIQPNKYWDYPEKEQKKSWSWVFGAMDMYGLGMEIEFEGTHGESGWSQYEEGVPRTSSSILEMLYTDTDLGSAGTPNPYAERNRQLLRDYMNGLKDSGHYGKARIATYSGTDAMYELATSTYGKDREMYLEYCNFIVNSPLRK